MAVKAVMALCIVAQCCYTLLRILCVANLAHLRKHQLAT
jgi:hypothetical protein